MTQKKVMDGMIYWWYDNHQVDNPTQIFTVTKWKCHVQERLATNKVSSSFLSNFSPVIANQYLFIFIKLEEDNICLLYNSTLQVNPSLCNFLMSLAKVKLILSRWTSLSLFDVLTSLTTKITRSFSCLESLKRDKNKTPEVLFHKIIP